MVTNNRISDLVSSQLPAFVREDHETFVRFLELYYEYLEQDGKVIDRSKNLYQNFDIDQSISEFSEKLYSNFIKMIPQDVITDKNVLVKHIQDFYKARGTEKSIQFLLRILFNKEATFYYPKRDVLRASDGKWFIEKSIRVGDVYLDGIEDETLVTVKKFANTRITGATSNASAIVEKVDVYYSKGVLINELKLSAQYRNFSSGETIHAVFSEEGEDHTLDGTVFAGFISEVEVLSSGEGYVAGTLIPVTSVQGNGGVVQIASVTSGSITTIGVTDGGAGFRANDYMTFQSLSGTGANAIVTVVDTSNTVSPNVYNVSWEQINTYLSQTLSGAFALKAMNSFSHVLLTNVGPVATISVLIGGNNYTEIPVMDVTANSLIRGMGSLGRIRINDGGLNYNVNNIIQLIRPYGSAGYGANAIVSNIAANGMITAYKWVQVPNFTIGGEGWTQDKLPTCNVVSVWGSGANLEVTAVMGDGEVLIGRTDTIGAILSMTIVSGGSGYANDTISINLMSYGDGTAQAVAYVVSGVYSYPGRYLNDDGFVSGYNFLQDNMYYQNYSYVVRISESINRYRKALKDLIHPIGLKLFGEYLIVDESQAINIAPSSAANSTIKVKFKADKPYTTSGNKNVRVFHANHGLSINSIVYLDFTTGDTGNLIDGYYMVRAVANTNTFNVYVSNTVTVTGNVDVGIVT